MPTSVSDSNSPVNDETSAIQEAEVYKPGELAPSIVIPENVRIWKPDDFEDKGFPGVIQTLVKAVSNADEAARRFQVLQSWELRHIDRGYQYLEADGKNGGWSIAGTSGYTSRTQNALAAMDDAGLYPTNIFSAQGDIATGALNRGKVKVTFAPARNKEPRDVKASEVANQYKYLWEKNNSNFQREITDLGWTDSRVLTWTRTIADIKFGVDSNGNPKTRQISTPFGVLESKCPMMVDRLCDMSYVQLFEEVDYAIARATYYWMGDKIKPSWGTYGELEFERIARINTRIGIIGKYITGTSGIREATMGYMWFRPGMYFDDLIPAASREFLLKNFPSGLFVIMAGPELCACWDESMDDVLELGFFTRGFGQNRRSLGSSDLPIQKRINIWADLWDKFVRSSIPITGLDVETWNPEAVSQLEASPKRFFPVAKPENGDLNSTMCQTPVAQPTPGMAEMFQWYVGPLVQAIDGCTPALFGGGEGQDNTVGATQIRLNQSLERFGPPWIMVNCVIAKSCHQAAVQCGRMGGDEMADSVEGYGEVSVNPSDLIGDFRCSPETAGMIPESGAQREAKLSELLLAGATNPQIAAIVGTPSNAREIVKGLHLDDVITVDEADWEDCALEDIEDLLDSEPLINPEWAQLNKQIEPLMQQHEELKVAAMKATASGQLDPAMISQGGQMEQQLDEFQQQLQQTPKYLPSITVPEDDSMDHVTIAETVMSWMGSPEGRGLRKKASRLSEDAPEWKKWTNVFLYWQNHKNAAAQNTQAQAPPPRVSLTGKLSPEQQAQLLMMQAGIQTSPDSLKAHEVEQETRLYTPISEVTTKTKRRL